MLERASACLDCAGSRVLLRGGSSKQTIRSRRMLHSAFWHHGACDLEFLPSWWATVQDNSPGDKSADPSTAMADYDQQPLFLNFLYPAKTMALLKTISTYGWEDWERRRQKSRHGLWRRMRQFSSIAGAGPFEGIMVNGGNEHDIGKVERLAAEGGDRAVYEELMSARPGDTRLDYDRIWNLFLSLDRSRTDRAVTIQTMRALALSGRIEDAERAIRLFEMLGTAERNEEAYKAAIIAFVHLSELSKGVEVCKQALENGATIEDAVMLLLVHCAARAQWALAFVVYSSYLRAPRRKDPESHKARQRLEQALCKISPSLKDLGSLVRFTEDQRSHDQRSCEDMNLFNFTRTLMHSVLDKAEELPLRWIQETLSQVDTESPLREFYYHNIIRNLFRIGRETNSSLTTTAYVLYDEFRSGFTLDREKEKSYPSRQILLLVLDNLCQDPGTGVGHATISNVINDHQTLFGALPVPKLLTVMWHYAKLGDAEKVRNCMDDLRASSPRALRNRATHHALLYAYARRGNSQATREALDRMSKDFDTTPSTRSWNILLHAYARADDVKGATDSFREAFLSHAGERPLQPDEYTFGPLLVLHSARGDVESVERLLDLAESKSVPMSTHLIRCLVMAYINAGDVASAIRISEHSVREKKVGRLSGRITPIWNCLLAVSARQRDPNTTMKIYKRMSDLEIRLDAHSYASIMISLTAIHKTDAAFKILRKVMPRDGIRPLGIHYAIVMAGYINQNMPNRAIIIGNSLSKYGVRETLSTRLALLRAKSYDAVIEKDNGEQSTMQELVKQLQAFLDETLATESSTDISIQQPHLGLNKERLVDADPELYVSFITQLVGRTGATDVVQQLLDSFSELQAKKSNDRLHKDAGPGINMISALMVAYNCKGDHEKVDQCWRMVIQRAAALSDPEQDTDRNFTSNIGDNASGDLGSSQAIPAHDKEPDKTGDELLQSQREALPAHSPVYSRESDLSNPPTQTDELRLAKPPPARADILNRPLNIYVRSLAARKRHGTVFATLSTLRAAGYTVDNTVLNILVQLLARSGWPLQAFAQCEKELMRDWRGWNTREVTKQRRSRWYRSHEATEERELDSSSKQIDIDDADPLADFGGNDGSDGIRGTSPRRIASGSRRSTLFKAMSASGQESRPVIPTASLVLPTYKTMIILGAVMRRVRRAEALGRNGREIIRMRWEDDFNTAVRKAGGDAIGGEKDDMSGNGDLVAEDLIGQSGRELFTVEETVGMRRLRKYAPRTVEAVESMPKIDDWQQRKYLFRSDGQLPDF
ncbi:hypothetical protein BDY21DRAFT_348380 [Lineolata rhizophorae]|uniref:Pentacotripeptide-repeat region of PRORP domain-containing protein n=1 Tax=Lineolata rhizophorae TaxID=578093 RepID=A0A6A6NXK1_9PEZI|nr:hypothetical protein BDY21DRAFT_348380 [Lineolata rhizophorae]